MHGHVVYTEREREQKNKITAKNKSWRLAALRIELAETHLPDCGCFAAKRGKNVCVYIYIYKCIYIYTHGTCCT